MACGSAVFTSIQESSQIDPHRRTYHGIIGVTAEGFRDAAMQAADVLLPQALYVAAERRADPGHPMWAFARLKPGVSIEQAKAELETVVRGTRCDWLQPHSARKYTCKCDHCAIAGA